VLIGDRRLVIKFGIHKGPIVTGVIGEYKSQYSLFGETLKVAKEACAKSSINRILVSVTV